MSDASGWGDPSTRTVEWHDPFIAATAAPTMDGVAFLEAIRDGRLPRPPMAALMRFAITEVERGRVVFECEPDASTYNPIGVVHGGLVCTLCDTVAGCVVQSTLDAGVLYTSVDLHVNYLRPVTLESGVLRATGLIVRAGRRVSVASAEVVDGAGRAVATALSSCLIIDPSLAA
ncbi:MAG: PaaI family thioesterase [Acidimicrobiales bacterium]